MPDKTALIRYALEQISYAQKHKKRYSERILRDASIQSNNDRLPSALADHTHGPASQETALGKNPLSSWLAARCPSLLSRGAAIFLGYSYFFRSSRNLRI